MSESLSFKLLGRCEYGDTLHMMKSHISNEDFKNEIWFLEHPPIFTLGTAADQKHILNARDIPIFQWHKEAIAIEHQINTALIEQVAMFD